MQKMGGFIESGRAMMLRGRAVMAGVLLLIFALYFANISLFSHYHIVDGVTIVHSHFHGSDHTQDPSDSSTHTKSALTLIHAISQYIAETAIDPTIVGAAYRVVLSIFAICNYHITTVAHVTHPPLRGPPTLF